jgi:hypothetical protein
LIETVKTSSNPVEKTPHTGTERIIYSDADKFVGRSPNSVETTWQRIVP